MDAATGSLGQGLAIGAGMALNAKFLDQLPYRTFVILGDSEMTEGSQWESLQMAVHYGLDNLIGILDVNRLGQRGETLYGHDLTAYQERISAFGWETIVIDGHSFPDILGAYQEATESSGKPAMIIARTLKGKGGSFLEDKNGWHDKALGADDLEKALGLAVRGKIPFVPTFGAFFARAFDQIRMSNYSGTHIVFVGSHAGVSIGQDGPSQMGLEDLAMFRTLAGGAVLYTADAVSTE